MDCGRAKVLTKSQPNNPMAASVLFNALFRAIHRGKLKELQEALAARAPVNNFLDGSGHDEYMPLHYAVDDEDVSVEVVQLLIDAGANVNARTKQPVSEDDASLHSTPRTAYTPLMLAAQQGRLDIIKVLVAAGADPREVFVDMTGGESPLIEFACRNDTKGHESVLRWLLESGHKPTIECLLHASREGSPGMVSLLLEAGLDPNDRSRINNWGVALHNAAANGREQNVAALLRAGADVAFVYPADNRYYPGQTALDVARKNRKPKVVALLEAAAKGGKPHEKTTSKSPASLPQSWKQLKATLPDHIKKLLIKAAAKSELKDAAKKMGTPEESLAVWAHCGGQKDGADGLFPDGFAGLDAEFACLSLNAAVREWTALTGLLKAGEFSRRKAKPDAGVRADWWNEKWIPFAGDGGGDFLCLDQAPDKGGIAGQVVLFRHDDPRRRRVAPSLTALLADVAEQWEAQEEH
jgi:ankyrin repeat protein